MISGIHIFLSVLSADRAVHAAVDGTDIITSWYLLDDVSGGYEYDVMKTADNGATTTETLTQLFHTFNEVTPGMYTVCVVAKKMPEDIKSVDVCSVIVTVSDDDGGGKSWVKSCKVSNGY